MRWNIFRSRRPSTPRRRPLQLNLETLEDRFVPASVGWTANANGNWFDAANWTVANTQPPEHRVPGIDDDASIGAWTVTVAGDAAVHSLSASGRLAVTSGSLTTAITSSTGELDLNAGTTLNVPADSTFTTGNNDDIAGTINVGASATLNLSSPQSISGTINLSTLDFLSLFNFDLSGTIVNPTGSTVSFGGTDHMNLNPGAALSGPGLYKVVGSVFGGPYLTLNTDVPVQNLTLDTNGGVSGPNKLTVTGQLDWVSGRMAGAGSTDVAAGASLNIRGGVSMDTRTVNNYGAATWVEGSTANIAAQTTATVFNNYGTANLNNDSTFFYGNGVFNNAGTFTKISASGIGASVAVSTFNNSGTVLVMSGSLDLNYDGVATGTFDVAASGTLYFSNSLSHNVAYTLNAGTVLQGAGFSRLSSGNAKLNVNIPLAATNFAVDSGTLMFLDANAKLTVSGALLLADPTGQAAVTGPGDITLAAGADFSWTGGILSVATTVQAGATLEVSGTAAKSLTGATLTNAGTATWSGSNFGIFSLGVFANTATGTLTIQADASTGFSNGTLTNHGTVTKTSPGTTTLSGIAVNTDGPFNVNNGVLEVNAGTSTGPITVASGSTLRFIPTGTYTLDAGAQLLGDGTYEISSGTGGTLAINTDVSANNVNLRPSGVLTGPATLTVNNNFNWTGGTMTGTGATTIAAAATLTLSGPVNKQLSGRTLNNAGTATWTDEGNINIGGAALFTNSGTFTIQTDAGFTGFASSTIANAGTLIKTSPGNTGPTLVAPALDNTGTVQVLSGTLQVNDGGTASGIFDVEGGSLTFTNATYNLNDGTSFIGPGLAHLAAGQVNVLGNVTAQNLALDAGTLTGAGSLTVSGGNFDWTGGSIASLVGNVVIAADGTLTIEGNGNKALTGHTLDIAGAAVWQDSGSINFSSNATLILESGGSLTILNDRGLTGSGFFSNSGTLIKAAGGGTTTIASGIAFSNDAPGSYLGIQSGTLQIDSYTQNAGQTDVGPGTFLASGGNTMTLRGGILSGAGTVMVRNGNGTLENVAGIVSPGPGGDNSVGTLTIDAGYIQDPLGTLDIDVAGAGVAGTDYDWLKVTGSATLNGTLNMNFLYTPAVGDAYTVLTVPATKTVAGAFAAVNAINLDPSLQCAVAYDPSDVTLSVSSSSAPDRSLSGDSRSCYAPVPSPTEMVRIDAAFQRSDTQTGLDDVWPA